MASERVDVSRIAKNSRIGAGAIAHEAPSGVEPNCIYMACGSSGYVGVVVLEDGRIDLAAALNAEAIRGSGGIGRPVERILHEAGMPEVRGVADLAWRGTPRLTRQTSCPAGERIFRVGDAAGYVEPFTGEGIAWALAGGVRLASILGTARDFASAELVRDWNEAYLREVVHRQFVCRTAKSVLGSPWLSRTAIGILGMMPGMARPVLRRLHQTI
jgi:flavin-dependent dehydrogenase